MDEHTIDYAVFNDLRERMGNKFGIIAETYIKDSDRYLKNITNNLNQTPVNLSAIIEDAHSLKSTSALLGLMQASNIAKDLEYKGKELRENQDFLNVKVLESIKEDLEIKAKEACEVVASELRKTM